jgi:hypothetical protein
MGAQARIDPHRSAVEIARLTDIAVETFLDGALPKKKIDA